MNEELLQAIYATNYNIGRLYGLTIGIGCVAMFCFGYIVDKHLTNKTSKKDKRS